MKYDHSSLSYNLSCCHGRRARLDSECRVLMSALLWIESRSAKLGIGCLKFISSRIYPLSITYDTPSNSAMQPYPLRKLPSRSHGPTSATQRTSILSLPTEIHLHILSFAATHSLSTLHSLARTSKHIFDIYNGYALTYLQVPQRLQSIAGDFSNLALLLARVELPSVKSKGSVGEEKGKKKMTRRVRKEGLEHYFVAAKLHVLIEALARAFLSTINPDRDSHSYPPGLRGHPGLPEYILALYCCALHGFPTINNFIDGVKIHNKHKRYSQCNFEFLPPSPNGAVYSKKEFREAVKATAPSLIIRKLSHENELEHAHASLVETVRGLIFDVSAHSMFHGGADRSNVEDWILSIMMEYHGVELRQDRRKCMRREEIMRCCKHDILSRVKEAGIGWKLAGLLTEAWGCSQWADVKRKSMADIRSTVEKLEMEARRMYRSTSPDSVRRKYNTDTYKFRTPGHTMKVLEGDSEWETLVAEYTREWIEEHRRK